jgi:hypothetical protein
MKSILLTLALQCSLMLMLGTYGWAEDLTFPKTRWSSPTDLSETDVALTLMDSALKIANAPRPSGHLPRVKGGAGNSVGLEVPYSTIARMSYGFTDRRRLLEGFVITPWLLATKAQSHWLAIEHGSATPYQVTLLRLDKTEFRGIIAALNAKLERGSKSRCSTRTARWWTRLSAARMWMRSYLSVTIRWLRP